MDPKEVNEDYVYWDDGVPSEVDPDVEGINYFTEGIRIALEKYYEEPISEAVIVDLGAGRGHGVSGALTELGATKIIAVDLWPIVFQYNIYPRTGIVADCASGLPFANDSIDIVVSTGSHGFLYENWREVYRILRPGGLYLGSDNSKVDYLALERFDLVIADDEFYDQIVQGYPEVVTEMRQFIDRCTNTLPLILCKD